MSKTAEQRLKEIVVNQLNVNEELIKQEASFLDDLGADSLDMVELLMAFEEEFKDVLPDGISDADAERLLTFGDVLKFVQNNGKFPQ